MAQLHIHAKRAVMTLGWILICTYAGMFIWLMVCVWQTFFGVD
jgi:hypothetical protein